MTRAVVFAYHDVGVRCLRTLYAHGVEVPLVVTHEDSPSEVIWFDSVAKHARWHGSEVAVPADPNEPGFIAKVAALRPDFIFSFYYRFMLKAELLAIPPRGDINMHGSLLPHYRGRVPVNWAVLHGERQAGATLHVMEVKPDAGGIAAMQAIPILPDDTAAEVFRKVTVAAEIALDGVLPALLDGTAAIRPQDWYRAISRRLRSMPLDWSCSSRLTQPSISGGFCFIKLHMSGLDKTVVIIYFLIWSAFASSSLGRWQRTALNSQPEWPATKMGWDESLR